jgi:hypothetical protein
MNKSLDRYFRFGETRNTVGNGKLKKQSRKRSNTTKPFTNERSSHKSNLMSDLLAAKVDNEDMYIVNFRNKPLKDKIFNAVVPVYVYSQEAAANKDFEKILMDLNALESKIKESEGEIKEKYETQLKSKRRKLISTQKYYTKQTRTTLRARVKQIRLRVIEIEKAEKGFSVLCEPAFQKH